MLFNNFEQYVQLIFRTLKYLETENDFYESTITYWECIIRNKCNPNKCFPHQPLCAPVFSWVCLIDLKNYWSEQDVTSPKHWVLFSYGRIISCSKNCVTSISTDLFLILYYYITKNISQVCSVFYYFLIAVKVWLKEQKRICLRKNS